MNDPTTGVSNLLRAWGRGDVEARDALMPLVYRELRRQAAAYLRRERPDHTLQPTALVNEAYLRLIGQARVPWQNRAHFFGIAAQMMRRILVDHARRHRAAKRPGAGLQVVWDDRIGVTEPRECELLALDQALVELTALDPRQGRIVELRYFRWAVRAGRRRGARSIASDRHPRVAHGQSLAVPPLERQHIRDHA